MFGKPSFPKLFDPKTGFFDPKTVIISKLFSKLFSLNFCEFKKPDISKKFPNLKKNFSETHKNKKFGNFRLMQGLKIR